MPHRVLLIDDDPVLIPAQVRQAFVAPDYIVDVATSAGDGIARIRANPPDVILLDLRLPDASGLDVFERIHALDARIPVIFVTAAKTVGTAIEAMKKGAFNYLHKPLKLSELKATVDEALEVARRTPAVPPVVQPSGDADYDAALVGSCPAMLDVYKAIGRVAGQDVTVLITGESGTGKELVARAIYQHSARTQGPFLALNCAAIPEHLLESELFGHEKGSFTGADRRRIGKFEQCNGGTILLDEIGDMPLSLQVKILRLLQEQTFERVGGNETIRTNVRVIATTHRDIRTRALEEKFRADLYYRLGVFTIHLPPLRERGDDLKILVEHLLRRFSRELGREVRAIAPEAFAILRAHSWPGNIRELQSVLKQALLQARGTVLLPSFLPELSTNVDPSPSEVPSASMPVPIRKDREREDTELDTLIRRQLVPGATDVYAEIHREVDRRLFMHALAFTRGNHRDAAKILGISRQTMRVKLRALGLSVTRSVEVEIDEEPTQSAG